MKSKLGPLVQESLLTGSAGRGRIRLREIPSGAGKDTFYPVLSCALANDYLAFESARVRRLRSLASEPGGDAQISKGLFVTAEIG